MTYGETLHHDGAHFASSSTFLTVKCPAAAAAAAAAAGGGGGGEGDV